MINFIDLSNLLVSFSLNISLSKYKFYLCNHYTYYTYLIYALSVFSRYFCTHKNKGNKRKQKENLLFFYKIFSSIDIRTA